MMNEYAELYSTAQAAGRMAAAQCVPTPMIVGTPQSIFSNKIDYSKEVEYVSDGVCGFAWINIKPARGPFVTWLKKHKIGRRDEYYGGLTIWVSDYNQSMTRKEAYARAFSKVLRDVGINARSQSRMD